MLILGDSDLPDIDLLRPTPFGGGNIYLWRLSNEASDDRPMLILRDVSELIARSEKRYADACAQDDENYANYVADVERGYLEDLAGSLFIILQSKIRRVISAAKELFDGMESEHAIRIDWLGNPEAVRMVSAAGHSKVDSIWHVGNYYKHRDEWSVEFWLTDSELEQNKFDFNKHGRDLKRARFTIDKVKLLGISDGINGSLFNVLQYFGIQSYSDCVHLARSVQTWAEAVYAEARTDLSKAIRGRAELGQDLAMSRPAS